MRFDLDDSIESLRDSIQEFARREIAPLAAATDRENRFPTMLWPKLGAMGALGITVPESYGGLQMGHIAHVVAMEEISRASAAIGLSFGAHSNLCTGQIVRHGTEAQKRRYLPPLVDGTHVGALAMSEAEAGSDVTSMRLLAERKGDRYLLNGSKTWVTNGPDANTVIVYAKTDPQAGAHGITAFIVEKEFKGLSQSPVLDKLGMRGSNTCELVFHDCEVPIENVLGTVGTGVYILMSGLDLERVVLAGGPLGILMACLDLVIPYTHARKQFGRPIGEFQLIQAKLADLYVSAMSARAYVYQVAKACDRGQIKRKDCAGAILYAAEKATWAAGETVQVLGGNGYTNHFAAGRLWRDAKLYEIGAGTSEIRRMLIGRELFRETCA